MFPGVIHVDDVDDTILNSQLGFLCECNVLHGPENWDRASGVELMTFSTASQQRSLLDGFT
jgi:hypothetical protein